MVSLRILFALPVLFSEPRRLGGAMLAVLAAATAGAVGGLAYSLTRPFLTRLATAGDYLTGVVCVGAYLGALCALAPIAFGESITKQRSDLVILGVISLVFGLLMGHRWFRDQD